MNDCNTCMHTDACTQAHTHASMHEYARTHARKHTHRNGKAHRYRQKLADLPKNGKALTHNENKISFCFEEDIKLC